VPSALSTSPFAPIPPLVTARMPHAAAPIAAASVGFAQVEPDQRGRDGPVHQWLARLRLPAPGLVEAAEPGVNDRHLGLHPSPPGAGPLGAEEDERPLQVLQRDRIAADDRVVVRLGSRLDRGGVGVAPRGAKPVEALARADRVELRVMDHGVEGGAVGEVVQAEPERLLAGDVEHLEALLHRTSIQVLRSHDGPGAEHDRVLAQPLPDPHRVTGQERDRPARVHETDGQPEVRVGQARRRLVALQRGQRGLAVGLGLVDSG